MSKQTVQPRAFSQAGAVLVFTLLALLILSVSAIRLMQSAALEERLSAYLVTQHTLLQGAQSALFFAETVVENWSGYSTEAGSQGVSGSVYVLHDKAYSLYSLNSGAHRWWLDTQTWQDKSTSYDVSWMGQARPASANYIIEEYGSVSDDSGLIVIYRITVRVESQDGTERIIQSLYASNKSPLSGSSSMNLGRWVWREI